MKQILAEQRHWYDLGISRDDSYVLMKSTCYWHSRISSRIITRIPNYTAASRSVERKIEPRSSGLKQSYTANHERQR